MRVLRADLLHDVGASINPGIDMGQVEGAFIQGMGWLTTEELVLRRRWTAADPRARNLQDPGRVRHASDLQYPALHPTQSDAEHLPLEGGRRTAADARHFGLFSAILDAVHATNPGGQPKLDPPCTPESILKAIASLNGAG
jgi:xanthine dehydrogenase large subunit